LMRELLEAIHLLLTGVSADDVPERGDGWIPCTAAGLSGLNLILGFDRLPESMPHSAYPYMLIDVGGTVPTERDYCFRSTIYFDIGVRQTGRLGALIGKPDKRGVVDYAAAVQRWVNDNQSLKTAGSVKSIKATVTGIEYTAQASKSLWSAMRYATLTVDYYHV
jgi:hypothetical protein